MKTINVYEYRPIEWLGLVQFNKTFSWEFRDIKNSSQSSFSHLPIKKHPKHNRPSTAISGRIGKRANNSKFQHKRYRYSGMKDAREEKYKMDIWAYNSKLISECLEDIKEVNNSLQIYPFKLDNAGIKTKYTVKLRQQSTNTNSNNEYGHSKETKTKSLLQAKNFHSRSVDENFTKKKWINIRPLNAMNIPKKIFPQENKLNLLVNRQKLSVRIQK